MDYKLNVVSDYENEVEVTVGYAEITPELDEAFKEERKNISHPGFRKGKVPVSIVKKLYGEAIEYKASEKIANKKFWDLVDEQNFKPISTPVLSDIKYSAGDKLEFKVKFEIKPVIEIKDYKGLKIDKPMFPVKDEDIEKEVSQLIKSQATFEDAAKIESEEFRITVDLQKLDESNLPVVGQKSQGIVIDLSDEQVNPQIRKNAIGKQVGEDFNFEFVDEHQHGDHTHTETFRYTATVTKIEKVILPEVNEEFIKKVSKNKVSTLDELKNFMRENYEKYYEQQSDSVFINSLLDKVVSNNEFTAPPGYVEMLTERMVEAEIENAKRSKRHLPGKEALAKNMKPRAEWNAKWQIILEKLAEVENIIVDDEYITKLAEQEAEKTGISVEKLVKYYKESNRADAFLEEKVIEFLRANNTANEINAEELAKKNKEKSDEK